MLCDADVAGRSPRRAAIRLACSTPTSAPAAHRRRPPGRHDARAAPVPRQLPRALDGGGWLRAGGGEAVQPGAGGRLLPGVRQRARRRLPAAAVRAQGQALVLGLVSSKIAELEDQDGLMRRIEEAARVLPLDQLALSTQCGFASVAGGNVLTEDEQWAKLELIVDIAERVGVRLGLIHRPFTQRAAHRRNRRRGYAGRALEARPSTTCRQWSMRINRLTADVRSRSGRVIFVRHCGCVGDDFEPQTPGWEFLPELQRHQADLVAQKTLNDPFAGTELKAMLGKIAPDRLLISGWATDFCVDATVRSAVSNGYNVVAVSDAHTLSDRPHLDARHNHPAPQLGMEQPDHRSVDQARQHKRSAARGQTRKPDRLLPGRSRTCIPRLRCTHCNQTQSSKINRRPDRANLRTEVCGIPGVRRAVGKQTRRQALGGAAAAALRSRLDPRDAG